MIDVLLATYNGEKYLETQLYSLLWQTHKDWRLIVHDDGSTDTTVAVIKNFQKIDNRIILIEDGIKCAGAAKNFLHLLSMPSDSEYFIFCDQDDIWFEGKLEELYKIIKDVDQPAAAYCNAYLYNGKKIIADKVTYFNRNSLENSLFLNSGVQGCSLIFNRKLKEKLTCCPDYVCMHDHLVTIAAVTFGRLLHTDLSLMLYRQHEQNVTGNIKPSLQDRFRSFINRNHSVIDLNHFKANRSFYNLYKSDLTEQQIKLFKAYFDYPNKKLLQRMNIVRRNSFAIGNSKTVLLLKTLIRRPI